MRILWVKTDLLHPATSGGRIRTLNMLRNIHAAHEVHYLALDDGAITAEAKQKAGEYSSELHLVPHRLIAKSDPRFFIDVARRTMSPEPVVLQRYVSAAMRSRVEQLLSERHSFDLCICDFLFPAVSLPLQLPCPTILFQHNVEARIWRRHAETSTGVRRIFFRMQHRKMRRAEQQLSRRFDGVIAVSESDAHEMRTEYGLERVGVVDTGVDTRYFTAGSETSRNPDEIMFLGSMDWMPNDDGVLWFAREVLPAIRLRHTNIKFTIVGRSPSPAVQALASDTVEVTGTVPDVRPYLRRAALFIVPLRVGGGTRIKLFEAMASGIPCVSTTIGAEGLPVFDGDHLVLADRPEEMASRVVELLANPERATMMGERAAMLVRSRYDWSKVAEQFIGEALRLAALPRNAALTSST